MRKKLLDFIGLQRLNENISRLENFYCSTTSGPRIIVGESKQEKISEEWKQVIEDGYLEWGESRACCIGSPEKGYHILLPTKKGKLLARVMGYKDVPYMVRTGRYRV